MIDEFLVHLLKFNCRVVVLIMARSVKINGNRLMDGYSSLVYKTRLCYNSIYICAVKKALEAFSGSFVQPFSLHVRHVISCICSWFHTAGGMVVPFLHMHWHKFLFSLAIIISMLFQLLILSNNTCSHVTFLKAFRFLRHHMDISHLV